MHRNPPLPLTSKDAHTIKGGMNLGERNSRARKRKARLPATVQKIVVVLRNKHEHRNEEIVEECRNLARKDEMIICMTPEPVPRDLVDDRLEREWLERINDDDRYWRIQCE
jgi:hypothetical protein